MPRPVTHVFTDELYAQMEPVVVQDEQYGWPMLTYLEGLTTPLHEMHDLTRDRDDMAGWGVTMNPDLCPPNWLDWLGQFNGKVLPASFTDVQKRIRIRETAGFDRGTLKGIIGAARQYLSDSRTVIVRERYNPSNPTVDSPWHLTVITYIEETASRVYPAEVLYPSNNLFMADNLIIGEGDRLYDPVLRRALLEQKPIGIILHNYVAFGRDYQETINSGRTYDQSGTLYPTYQDRTGDY